LFKIAIIRKHILFIPHENIEQKEKETLSNKVLQNTDTQTTWLFTRCIFTTREPNTKHEPKKE